MIDQVARSAVLGGRVKGAARRAMSPALAIRFTVLMTLIPDADYPAVMEALLGNLVLVPWQRPCRVPTAAAACTWREALGPAPLERLRDLALAGVDGEHRSHDYRAVTAGDLEAGSIDGSLIRVPDTPANRAAFGSAGTADDSSPFPQLRELRISAASTRATFGVTTGPAGAGGGRDKGEAEQVLLDKAVKDYGYLFTPWRLWVMDRNFPGVPRIKAMLEAGTHLLIRVRDGITLRRAGDFLPDGSYLAEISGGGITLTVRVIEYTVTVADRDAPELFCLVTDLHDHAANPARQLAQAYLWRWIVGNLPEGGQVRHQRRRAVHRADAPLRLAAPGPPGAGRLGDRRRAGPRHRPRRRSCRHPGPQRPPRRPAGAPPPDLVHRRPPGRHHLGPGRRGDRQPARRPHHGEPGRHPGWPGPAPRPGRPLPAPRPQGQCPARLPAGRAAPRHPHRASRDQPLPAPDRLTPDNTRRPVEPAAARSDSPAPRHVHHSP